MDRLATDSLGSLSSRGSASDVGQSKLIHGQHATIQFEGRADLGSTE